MIQYHVMTLLSIANSTFYQWQWIILYGIAGFNSHTYIHIFSVIRSSLDIFVMFILNCITFSINLIRFLVLWSLQSCKDYKTHKFILGVKNILSIKPEMKKNSTADFKLIEKRYIPWYTDLYFGRNNKYIDKHNNQ